MYFKKILLFFIFTLLLFSSFSQKAIWIQEDDAVFLKNEYGERVFKDSLPDGHYISYGFSKKFKAKDVYFLHQKKNGIENRYFSGSEEKYATIEWKEGKRNGPTIYYNTNGTIGSILNFKNGILDGHFIINWSEGEKNYEGFFKNGMKDGIWIYYALEENQTGINAKYWKAKEIEYRHGVKKLLNAWDKKGNQLVKDGNSLVHDPYAFSYKNGLKDGITILKDYNSDSIEMIQSYKKGLLINEVRYYKATRQIMYNKSWDYDTIPKIDTIKDFADTYITEFFCKEIEYKYEEKKDGEWTAYFENGIPAYHGIYADGIRKGIWTWNYKIGSPRILADYYINQWHHFDSTGKELNCGYKTEYLTALTDHPWFLNQGLDSSVVVMESFNLKTVTPMCFFSYDGTVNIEEFLECGKFIGHQSAVYYLTADKINLKIPGEKKEYSFVIVSADEKKLILRREKASDVSLVKE